MTPKRKRTSAGTTSLPQIDTIIADAALDSEPDSPRSKVAANLCQLQIHDQNPPPPPAPYEYPQSHAVQTLPFSQPRPHTVQTLPVPAGAASDMHLRPAEANSLLELDTLRALVTPPKDKPARTAINTAEGSMEICETPGAYNVSSFTQRLPSSPPTSPSPSPLKLDQPSTAEDNMPGTEDTESEAPHQDTMLDTKDTEGRRGNVELRRNNRTSAGRPASSKSLDMEIPSEVQSPTFTLELPKPTTGRRKKKCAPTPVTAPPPPTPLASPGEELTTEPLLASATAKMLSLPIISSQPQNPYSDNTDDVPPSPRPTKKKRKSPSPPSSNSSLTWKNSEITGHLWDPSMDVDDDGEGINGVGFRPTPAIEWKRKESRKRQITEWRAREAKEDRRRRFEKRKMGRGSLSSSDGVKHVSFGSSSNSDGVRHVSFGNMDQGGPVHEAEDGEGQEGKRARVRFAEVA